MQVLARRRCSPPVLLLLAATFVLAGGGMAGAENWNKTLFGLGGFYRSANLNLLAGMKFLDGDSWEPVEQQPEVGFDFDYMGEEWPVALTGSVLYSRDDDSLGTTDIEVTTFEAGLGLRKIWYRQGRLQPYLDAGVSIIGVSAEKTVRGRTSKDDGNMVVGGWVGGGTYFVILDWLTVGANLRWSTGVDVSLYGNKADPGGLHALATVGYRWREW